MKRHLAFALVAVATIAACSKEDLQPGQASPASNSFLVATVWEIPTNSFRLIKYYTSGALGGDPFINRTFSTAVSFDAYPDINERGDKLVYIGNDSIYLMDIESGESIFLYKHEHSLIDLPKISEDGTRIAFSEYNPLFQRRDVYVMNAVPGSRPVNITRNVPGNYSSYPVFNADATRIAFTKGDGENDGIYVSDLQGNNMVRISEEHSFRNMDMEPLFTKDGNRLIYASDRFNHGDWPFELVASGIGEGSETSCTRLTTLKNLGLNVALHPTFSADGRTLYFYGYSDTQGSFVYSMRVPGGNPEKLTACMLGSDEVIVGLNYVNTTQTGR
jgi:Tol biopolymer transport system component